MMSTNNKIRFFSAGLPAVLFALAPIAHAQIGLDFLNLPAGAEIGTILSRFYVFGVSMTVILALIMFTFGGVQYMIAGDRDPGPAKQRMKDALFGLILALTSYLILYTINPDLVREVKLNVNIIDLRQQPVEGAREGEPCKGGSSAGSGEECGPELQCYSDARKATCSNATNGEAGHCYRSCTIKVKAGPGEACNFRADCANTGTYHCGLRDNPSAGKCDWKNGAGGMVCLTNACDPKP